MSELLPGVEAGTVEARIRMHHLTSGPADGEPVVLVHGNLSTGRFFEHLMSPASDRWRFLAPDMRGFGRTEPAPIDATRGLGDWADDLGSYLDALGIERPHLVGWSTAGAAIALVARARPVASLTFLDPVSPYGYGGTFPDGRPCWEDFAGSGAGVANPQFVAKLREGDRSGDDALSPRNVMANTYWAPDFRLPRDREDLLVDEILLSTISEDGYPGDATTSEHWPGAAPGTRGLLNALSPKYCDWSWLPDLDPKPPVLWTHGTADVVVADGSMLELGTLGQAGVVPGWPGADTFPPQPMVAQIRTVLERYAAAGGTARMEMFEGSGHGPHVDAAERWLALATEFWASA
ncbi:alpha/beta fold hydrolase [Actinomycetospora termitidis]|uniref:Alpha/beta hydrolase n=1 Tax=Actinomycetospora termitidis TaxID=3053470 RepID=A0ABT7MH85_9PSEU|nr:alpha/beta hydrolase [Actinomycetospora sp. Odt1-22]MDL5159227.1 alpha/beta hydrolase [Actinomycetospora sp. Odt1-22]